MPVVVNLSDVLDGALMAAFLKQVRWQRIVAGTDCFVPAGFALECVAACICCDCMLRVVACI